MYFCRSWFSNMVSFRYVLVVLNFLHDIFSIKFYTISFLWDLFMISFTFFFNWWETLRVNVGYWSKSISWKYFISYEMTLKLYFMKCPERKISWCILPIRLLKSFHWYTWQQPNNNPIILTFAAYLRADNYFSLLIN